jgi:hypothetical protein
VVVGVEGVYGGEHLLGATRRNDGRSAGDVGAAAFPARRRRRGARPQPLGGDAGTAAPPGSLPASCAPPLAGSTSGPLLSLCFLIPEPPALLPSLLAGAIGIGRETQAAAEQGAAAGMDFKRGGRLGFEVQADGGDLRHPCPEARGAHPVASAARGVAWRPGDRREAAAPPRTVCGRQRGRETGERAADERAPYGGDRRRGVGGSWAGWR